MIYILRKIIPYGLALVIMILTGAILIPQPIYADSGSCPSGTTMNLVAHEDDDLLFLNPDIQNDILAGRCVVTVFLTAGDANLGIAYWTGRENGEKVAYSFMNSTLNLWTQQDAGITGHPMPVFTLINVPTTSLVFVRIPDGNYDGTGFSNNNYESLQKLWQGNISTITTIDHLSSYTKQNLINALLALMNKYQPDIIRTQNFVDPYNSSVDHSDHYSTAYLTQAASQLYSASHLLIGYYDYEINSQPQNIFGTNATVKQNTFISYAQYDPNVCQTLSACLKTKYGGWFVREYAVATVTPVPTSTPTPVPSATPTPSPSVSPTPIATPSPTPTSSPFTNIAPLGSGYRWSQMSSATDNTNQIAESGMNDNNLTTNIRLNGGPDDNSNAYEGAGIIWTSGQNNITRVEYINGSWETSLNGAFTANFQLQTTTDGITWTNTGIYPTVAYNYDNSSSSGKTYVFNGILPNNLKGVRIIGQVRTKSALSWYANTREVMVETGSISPTPSPTPNPSSSPTPIPTISPIPTPSPTPSPSASPTSSPTPTPSVSPTPSPTAVPGGSELLSGGTWTLSGGNGAAEKDIGITSSTLSGKSSVIIRYDLHGTLFGMGDDEASIIFIQNNDWYAVNIIPFGGNGLNGIQQITLPLSAFHKVGSSGSLLDLTKTVSNLHSRFWNKNTFTVDIFSVSVQ